MQQIFSLFRLSKPTPILITALTYVLGAGVARYLGNTQDLLVFWLGLGGVLLAQFSMGLLAEALRPVDQPSEDDLHRAERVILRKNALMTSLGALGVAALIAILMGQARALTPTVMLFLGLSLLAVLAYAVPPVRLVDAGFGEFTLAVHVAMLVPALGFVLQYGEYHRMVAIFSFPLTMLALAYLLVLDFPTFANDEKFDRVTLLRSIGWQRAVPLHNGLVLGAYVLLAGAQFFGVSWALIWPAMLTLPFALFQLWQVRNIGLGARPVWNLLTVTALAVFGLTAYLITFAFWLR